MLKDHELLALLPLLLLAVLYIGRDILMFNRLQSGGKCVKFTNCQLQVAFILYPIWVFLTWIENLAQKREDYAIVAIMNIVTTYVGWWTKVALFNDKFESSRQQVFSLGFSFALSALWRVTNILIFS